jgi:tetratricopeptide (TPR) repeat protein
MEIQMHANVEPSDPQIRECWRQTRSACFDEPLHTKAGELWQRLLTAPDSFPDEIEMVMARRLVCEVFQYFGRFDDAEKIVTEQAIKVELAWRSDVPKQSDLRRVKQHAWLMLHRVRCLFLRNDYGEAERLLGLAEQVLRDSFGEIPHGTMARIAYQKAQIFRQQSQMDESEKWFLCSIEETYRRFQEKETKYRNDPVRLSQEHANACHLAARALSMGLAWIYFNNSQLNRARPLLASARILAARTRDVVLTTFIQMILGCIARSDAGVDPSALRSAIDILHDSFDKFDPNRRYQAIAAHHLALAYLHLGDLNQAEEYASKVAEYRVDDQRWLANSSIVRSRVCRQRGDLINAGRWAEQASKQAHSGHHPTGIVEAIIELGEVASARGDRNAARDLFEEALARSKTFSCPKLKAVCHLHIASSFIADQNIGAARQQMHRWKELEPVIEGRFLKSVAAEIYRKLGELETGFYIDKEVGDLDYGRHCDELQKFLYSQALSRSGGDKARAAKLMKVSRQSVYMWADPEKYKRPSTSARRSSKRGAEPSQTFGTAPLAGGGVQT